MTNKAHNVFLSWSGQRSRFIAEALRDWLPMIVQAAKPWMSEADIDKGSRGLVELGRALDGLKVGIICLTPENLKEPWILYEAGALSKSIDEKSRLCTYLLAGLQPQDVKPPLGMFQATQANKDDTRKLIHTINRAVSEDPVPQPPLDRLFDQVWSELEGKLNKMPAPEEFIEAKRPTDEMVAEILELTRGAANERKKVAALDQYIPVFQRFMPLLSQAIEASDKPLFLTAPSVSGAVYPGAVQMPVAESKKLFCVKLRYEDEIKKIAGTRSDEIAPGSLVVYDGHKVIARFDDGVERWWTESGA